MNDLARPPHAALALALVALAACKPESGGDASATAATTGTTASTTAGTTASTTADATTGTTADTTTGEAIECLVGLDEAAALPRPWDPGQPEIAGCQVRGVREYRAIIHLHSPHSHDACDGDPQPGGVLDEACLADLRAALCTTRIDVAFLTDHPAFAADATLAEMVLTRGADQPVVDDQGRTIANWIACEGDAADHRVLLIPGIESSAMMPLGITEHAADGTYDTASPAAFQAIREVGGLAWVAHTESRTIDELAPLGLDGLEFYQLHANLDPDIREDYLGLDPAGFLTESIPFFFPSMGKGAEPDLATLGFLLPNEPSITTFEALGQTQRLTISAGTDAHQNVLPNLAPDGERVDSYRRMIRWFNNRLRIDGPLTVESAKAALAAGRAHIVFESFGTPLGFDLHARAGGVITEMGAEVTHTPGLELVATLPTLDPRSPRAEIAPLLRGVLVRASKDGREVLAEWNEGEKVLALPGPGVYRVEVWITPRHLAPYLGDYQEPYLSREVPWIYSGAIFVRPGA